MHGKSSSLEIFAFHEKKITFFACCAHRSNAWNKLTEVFFTCQHLSKTVAVRFSLSARAHTHALLTHHFHFVCLPTRVFNKEKKIKQIFRELHWKMIRMNRRKRSECRQATLTIVISQCGSFTKIVIYKTNREIFLLVMNFFFSSFCRHKLQPNQKPEMTNESAENAMVKRWKWNFKMHLM